jgi:nicotinamidase-related amidase
MRNQNLHGNAPDKSPVALLLIDVINDLEFDEGAQLLEFALPMADRLADLIRHARAAEIPIIYVNDNFGRWRSDFRSQVEHCLRDGVRGEPVVQRLLPKETDYFVLKPKHSGFYSTGLDILLRYVGCSTLVLTGIATNLCVFFTASDAYLRDFRLFVPEDCSAANSLEEHQVALEQMRRLLKVDTRPSTELRFDRMRRAGDAPALIGNRDMPSPS